MRGIKYHEGYKKLLPGDIIVTNDRKKLTSLLIPGEFSHAALCISKDQKWEVSEMTHTDYTKSAFFDICKESDRVVILRCDVWKKSYVLEVIKKCKGFVGAKYDQEFELGVEALYCSELVYMADFKKLLDVNLDDLAGLGRLYLSPDGLFKAKNVKIIWDSDKSNAKV